VETRQTRETIAPHVSRLVACEHPDPHLILGAHLASEGGIDGVAVRAFRPDASQLLVLPIAPDGSLGAPREAERIHRAGVFEAFFADRAETFRHRLAVVAHGRRVEIDDPYAHLPTLGELDLHLFAEGRHRSIDAHLGAHHRVHEGVAGTAFAVWAPEARRVSVVGPFNDWDGRFHPMRRLSGGVWELFLPGVAPGDLYKYEIAPARGPAFLKLDPFARRTELRPATGGVVPDDTPYAWGDRAWMEARRVADAKRGPMCIYEVHLGGFMRVPEERGHGAIDRPGGGHTGRWLGYREIAPYLVEHVRKTGFTHVELMPITEHPFDGSWGYQVTGYYSPTARWGAPEDLKFLIDSLHQAGIGVILDWVPAHFPRDAHGLRRFDGSALYEHLDPRQGEHADWGTMVFNLGRPQVKNFLIGSALHWLREFHFDGLRVDAVASMLYLDYSRKPGEWVPNRFGGRENLDAIEFLRELNVTVGEEAPGAAVIAEESTAWPAVSKPVYTGGLGFSFKWNMGWMHDILAYFSLDPIHRRFHHQKITFSFMYAWSEHYVLPLSHDEVVHMKGSLLGKMPGDRWQKFANLRALYAYMWAHPGKKLLFMGGELAQLSEFSEERSLDWHLQSEPLNGGVLRLMSDLNALLRSHPALYALDVEPRGFRWIDANDAEQSVATFMRFAPPSRARTMPASEPPPDEQAAAQVAPKPRKEPGPWQDADFVVAVLNATPIVRRGYRVGVPRAGSYRRILNTDAREYGGSGVDPGASCEAEAVPAHGLPYSLRFDLPPLAMIWLEAPPAPAEVPNEDSASQPDGATEAARTVDSARAPSRA
jgi:1,4-alpha-glucan branching enzyme